MRRGWAVTIALSLAFVLVAGGCAAGEKPAYTWQIAQALPTADGDLQWSPEPFVFQKGRTVRYIDYEKGNDNNSGAGKNAAWKHHPWDPDASGKASAARGPATYVFKRGVVYRGVLKADESGTPAEPIRLTMDPTWGAGQAAIYGSDAITRGWRRADAASAPGIPEPQKVWYTDVGTAYNPMALWLVEGDAVTRIPIARDPNWTVTSWDDVKSNWYEWQSTAKEQVGTDAQPATKCWGTDAAHLTATDPNAYAGGTVWTEYSGVMGQPYANPIEAYDPARHAIRFAGPWGDARQYAPVAHCRYFIENLPRLLDSPGEYYYDANGPHPGRLYVRLPGDADPNKAHLEAARRLTLIDVSGQSHIHISGLTFRFQNVAQLSERWFLDPLVDPACVKALGSCDDVRVSNCRFDQVAMAVWAVAEKPTAPGQAEPGLMDNICVTDNDISNTDYGAISLERGKGEFIHASVMRNRLNVIGQRPSRAKQAPALAVEFAMLTEAAGNILDRCYGAGVFIFGGKGSGEAGTRPLSRILVHHNKVTNSLLTINDYGGIESWQGGPTYSYDNVSGNPGGYWHWKDVSAGTDAEKRDHTTARFGHAYYMDGAFKQYYFNNIAWGKSNDLSSPLCNTSAFQEIIGYQNAIFNNTAYNFAAGSRRQAAEAGRNLYLGNVWAAISEIYFRHSDARPVSPEANAADVAAGGGGRGAYAVDTDAYADNVFSGTPRAIGAFESTGVLYKTLDTFREALMKYGPPAGSVGVDAGLPPLRDVANHDFRPAPGSPVTGRGVKLFVPWGLYAVVGEWNFYKHPAAPAMILDESWYMTDAFAGREMYRLLPHSDLTGQNIGAGDFVKGTLEDWTEGALRLNGKDQYCVLADADLKSDIQVRSAGGRRGGAAPATTTIPGASRRTVDMDTNNFLIEAVLKIDAATTGGRIVSKGAGTGYVLDVDPAGRARMRLFVNGVLEVGRVSSVVINDGKWHHLIAEVDRDKALGVTIYVDGVRADGASYGTMPAKTVSLSNTADFFVGKGPEKETGYLAGTIDFLRVARGTLADARTTIGELYEWEFHGPFLRDFAGQEPVGGKRDAGAIGGR